MLCSISGVNFVSCSTRCWDIIENTDVFWWIIKTPILASILVSLQASVSLKFHYINIYAPWAVKTLISDSAKLIDSEREDAFVSYHQSISNFSVSVIHVKAFEFTFSLVFSLYVNTTKIDRTSKFSLHFGKFVTLHFFASLTDNHFLQIMKNSYRNICTQIHTDRLKMLSGNSCFLIRLNKEDIISWLVSFKGNIGKCIEHLWKANCFPPLLVFLFWAKKIIFWWAPKAKLQKHFWKCLFVLLPCTLRRLVPMYHCKH